MGRSTAALIAGSALIASSALIAGSAGRTDTTSSRRRRVAFELLRILGARDRSTIE